MTACGDHNGLIKSVPEVINVILGLENDGFTRDRWPSHKFPFGLWFRGQAKFGKPLDPPIFRQRRPGNFYDETNLFEHLRGRAPGYSDRYSSAFDWLCLMQHYSIPTRLLDWSEGVLPALYFAVSKDSGSDGELIVLNARRLNKSQKKRPTIFTPKHPAVIIRSELAKTRSMKTFLHERVVIDALAAMDVTDLTTRDILENFPQAHRRLPLSP